MRKLLALGVLCPWLAFGSALAQVSQAASQEPVHSTVTGRVLCGDTGLPARFAVVQLLPARSVPEPLARPQDFASGLQKAMEGRAITALTRIDGSFRLENVMPGVYYVIPQLAGYLTPLAAQFSLEELASLDAEARRKIESSVEEIAIEPGHTLHIDLKLIRGGALSGQITYDDGAPAENVITQLFLREKNGTWKPVMVNQYRIGIVAGTTDDQGRYRYSGLPAGEYGVMATLPTTQVSVLPGTSAAAVQVHLNDALQVYSGNVYRQREMKGFSLGLGEDQSGADIIFPVSSLFSLAGHVVAGRDPHAVATGIVVLRDPVDHSDLRTAFLALDGAFSFSYLPSGSYLLHLESAADLDPASKPSPDFADPFAANAMRRHLREYAPTDVTIMMEQDVPDFTVIAPDQSPKGASSDSAR